MNNVLSEHLFDAFWNCTRYFQSNDFGLSQNDPVTKKNHYYHKLLDIFTCFQQRCIQGIFVKMMMTDEKYFFFSKIQQSGRISIQHSAAASNVPPALNVVIYLCHSLLTISRKIFLRTLMNCVFEINCHKISCFTHLSKS